MPHTIFQVANNLVHSYRDDREIAVCYMPLGHSPVYGSCTVGIPTENMYGIVVGIRNVQRLWDSNPITD